MALYRVHSMALRAGETNRSMNRRNATLVIAALVVVGVPLTLRRSASPVTRPGRSPSGRPPAHGSTKWDGIWRT
jgi:hypothetical protein